MTATATTIVTLYVRCLDTKEIMHSVELHDPTYASCMRVVESLTNVLDTTKFYVDDGEADALDGDRE